MKKYALQPGKIYIRIAPYGEINRDYSYSDKPVLIKMVILSFAVLVLLIMVTIFMY